MQRNIGMMLLMLLASGTCAAQDQTARDAMALATEAQRAATKAILVGSAEGLFRGCKASVELRKGPPSEPDLVLALDLAGECEAYAAGVASTVTIAPSYSLGAGCHKTTDLTSQAFINAVVDIVEGNPLFIGKGTTQQSLTWEALRSLSGCPGSDRSTH